MTCPFLINKGRVTNRTFKSTYQILYEISQVWDTLTDVTQANILEQLGGKRNSNVVAALINGFEVAADVVDDSMNAAGSALAENETYLDSINGKLTQLAGAFERLSTSVIDSEVVKFLLDVVIGITDAANALAEVNALLPVTLGLVTGIMSVRTAKGMNDIAAGIIGAVTGNMTAESAEVIALTSAYSNLTAQRQRHTSAIITETLAKQGYTQQQIAERLTALGLADVIQAQTGARAANTAATGAQTGASVAHTAAMGAETAAANKLNLSLKALLLSNPLGWILTAVSLIPMLISGFQALTKSNDELIQDAKDLKQEYDSALTSISDNLATVRGYEDEFYELAKGVDEFGNNISLSADEYERYREIVKSVTDATPELISGYDAEGDAIANKNALIERSIELLEEERRVNAQARISDESMSTLYEGAIAELKELQNSFELPDSIARPDFTTDESGRIVKGTGYDHVIDDYIESVIGVEKVGASLSKYIIQNAEEVEAGLGEILEKAGSDFADENGHVWKAMTEEQVSDLRSYLQNVLREANSVMDDLRREMQYIPQAMDEYSDLSDAQRSVLTSYINGLHIDAETTEQEFDELRRQVEDFTAFIAENDDLDSTLRLGFNLTSATDASGNDITVAQYEENLRQVLSDLEGLDEDVQIEIKAALNIDPETNVHEADIAKAVAHARNLLKDEFDEAIDNMSIDDIMLAYRISAAPNSMTLDELQQKIVEIGTDWNSMINAWDFTTLSDGLGEVDSQLSNLVSAMSSLQNGTRLSVNELANLALQYPELLKASNLFTDTSIDNQYALLDAVLSSYETEYDAVIETKIKELEATGELIRKQIELEDDKRDKVIEIADLQANGQLDSVRDYQDILNDLKDLEGKNYATFSQGVLDVNEDMLNKQLAQMKDSVEESKNIWEAQGNVISNSVWEGLSAGLKSLPLFSTKVAQWAENSFSPILSGIGTEIKNATSGGKTGYFDFLGAASGASGYTSMGKNPFLVTLEGKLNLESSYTIDGKSVDEWSSDYQEIIQSRVDTLNEALEDNQIMIDNLRALKGLDLHTLYADQISGTAAASDTIKEYIAYIEDYREALERLSRIQIEHSEIDSMMEATDDLKEQIELENVLLGVYEREKDALEVLNRLRDQTISNGAITLRELGFDVDYDANLDRFFVRNLEHLNELTADSKGEYESLQEATNALREDTEDLIDSLVSLNQENQEGNESWRDLENQINDSKINIINNLKEIVSQASEAVDTIQGVYDTLHAAADEYAATGGYISVDTFQSIVELGPEYMQFLMDENDQLLINEETIKNVIAAQTQRLAVENAMAYVMRLREALEEGSVENLNNLLFATLESTDATWGLVYANLALLDLNGEQYSAALHNINTLRSLAENAMDGIWNISASYSSELEDMKSGLDSILEYVMQMLEDRIERQIDKLEEMKDTYAELIELKKESLETSRDEEDYQDDIADRVREIAELQAKIDALSLDDSRDAQAQRADLLEEMNELQKELADQQRDHAIEQQQESLDEMQEAYEDQKDQEIDVLEQSISSQEKLYRMAYSIGHNHSNVGGKRIELLEHPESRTNHNVWMKYATA